MWRYLAGAASALLLAGAGLFWWQARQAPVAGAVPPAPFAARAAGPALPPADPPQASEKTREERRFGRYDRDKDGGISRDEYLAARRRAFAKLDANGDGRLQFEEYAAATIAKFQKADADGSAVLDAPEFATTRMIRKAPARPKCDCSAAVAAALEARAEAE